MKRTIISLGVALGLTSGVVCAEPSTWDDAQKVFNKYEASEQLLPVSGYMSNWGVYGRQFNVQDIIGKYDKIIYSFVGLCGTEIGDPTVTSAVTAIKKNCDAANKEKFEIAFTDLNSDINNDFGAGANWNATFYTGQEKAGGIIGVLRDAKVADPGLELALSVGGWSLSEPFSRMAESKANRTTFINSAIEWFKLYPMFDQIDIDWEYPGGGGAELNSWSEKDGEHYLLLIKELRAALDKNGFANKKIAIAAAAPKDKLVASNLKALVNNGVDYIHLMTYDFMGEWQNKLAHHTNLSGSLSYIEDGKESFNSAESSIDFMVNELGIPSETIMIGYAGYSRNAGSVNLESASPLIGSFIPGTSTHDSFETGVAELFDYQGKLIDYSATGAQGLQGFELYTDIDANADFLYNNQTKQFLSIDTPRTVYAKAKFAKENNLGGIFAWMADHDPGYHINAAREGLGYKALLTELDMNELNKACGINVSDAECEILNDVIPDNVSCIITVDKTERYCLEAGQRSGYSLPKFIYNKPVYIRNGKNSAVMLSDWDNLSYNRLATFSGDVVAHESLKSAKAKNGQMINFSHPKSMRVIADVKQPYQPGSACIVRIDNEAEYCLMPGERSGYSLPNYIYNVPVKVVAPTGTKVMLSDWDNLSYNRLATFTGNVSNADLESVRAANGKVLNFSKPKSMRVLAE